MSQKNPLTLDELINVLPVNELFTKTAIREKLASAGIYVSPPTLRLRFSDLIKSKKIKPYNPPSNNTASKFFIYKAIKGTKPKDQKNYAPHCYDGSHLSEAAFRMLHGKLV